jgi:hypothetical protein
MNTKHAETATYIREWTRVKKFAKIRRIRSPPNFKIGDFTVHRLKIFEKIKNM